MDQNLITIDEAARQLGAKPYDVIRLIQAGDVATVTLVDGESLRKHKEKYL